MGFTISAGLAKILNGLRIAEDNALAAANEIAEKYPDAAEFEQHFVEWLRLNADPSLAIDTLTATLSGIARDILSGKTEADPTAFGGSV
jgi:hypothetical protein